MYKDRIQKVQDMMLKEGLRQILIANSMSVYYLTGEMIEPFERFWGVFLAENDVPTIIANKLFCIHVKSGFRVLWYEDGQDITDILLHMIDTKKTLGIDREIQASVLLPLLRYISYDKVRVASHCVDAVRAIKSQEEILYLKKAAALADKCAEKIPEFLYEGITEEELGRKIVNTFKMLGADTNSCGMPLIAFGKNAGNPHHCAENTKLRKGDEVLADIGCKVRHYCSDLTRTYFFGEPAAKKREIYEVVRTANEKAEAAIEPGITFEELDGIARKIIQQAGYGSYFTHRLGHSIGLEGHEGESVAQGNKNKIKENMTFSIEPGIYIPGEGGVRIEDIVLVTEKGCEVLNSYRK